jgi:hypothetical protein
MATSKEGDKKPQEKKRKKAPTRRSGRGGGHGDPPALATGDPEGGGR